MTCIVYGLASSENGKIRYVGQTTQLLHKRFDSHLNFPKNRRHVYVNKWIASVIRKKFNVICFPIENDAVYSDAEKRWIAWYRSHGARLVNLTDGGEGIYGLKRSKEFRLHMSHVMRGKKKTPEHIEKIASCLRGRQLSDEHKRKVSNSLKGRMPKNLKEMQIGNRGIVRSEELRRRISNSLVGRQVTSREKLLANLEKARAAIYVDY